MVDTQSLVFLSRKSKVLFSLAFVMLAIISLSLSLYYVFFIDAENDFVLMSLSIAQASIIGAGIFTLILFYQKSMNPEQLAELTNQILETLIPSKFKFIDFEDAVYSDPDGYKSKTIQSNITVAIKHVKGVPFSYYKLKDLKGNELTIYIQLNVKRIVVVYFFDSEKIPQNELLQRFSSCIDGAKNTGYECITGYGVKDGQNQSELKFFMGSLGEDFLNNSKGQLFLANDIAFMTRSIWQIAF